MSRFNEELLLEALSVAADDAAETAGGESPVQLVDKWMDIATERVRRRRQGWDAVTRGPLAVAR